MGKLTKLNDDIVFKLLDEVYDKYSAIPVKPHSLTKDELTIYFSKSKQDCFIALDGEVFYISVNFKENTFSVSSANEYTEGMEYGGYYKIPDSILEKVKKKTKSKVKKHTNYVDELLERFPRGKK